MCLAVVIHSNVIAVWVVLISLRGGPGDGERDIRTVLHFLAKCPDCHSCNTVALAMLKHLSYYLFSKLATAVLQ